MLALFKLTDELTMKCVCRRQKEIPGINSALKWNRPDACAKNSETVDNSNCPEHST